jgi:hypothetical protein
MVILGLIICFSFGTCAGLLMAGICSNASDKHSV